MKKQVFIEALALYHLIIVLGFVIACFITMENQFIHFNIVTWDKTPRACYLLFFMFMVPFIDMRYTTLSKVSEERNAEMAAVVERMKGVNK